jgi:hypothetical protein
MRHREGVFKVRAEHKDSYFISFKELRAHESFLFCSPNAIQPEHFNVSVTNLCASSMRIAASFFLYFHAKAAPACPNARCILKSLSELLELI